MRPPTTMHSPWAARRQPWVRAASDSNECNSATARPWPVRYAARARDRPASATQTIVEPLGAHSAPTWARRSTSGGWRSTRAAKSSVPGSALPVATASATSLATATWFGADADRNTATRGPDQRHAIHSVSATTSGGGPADTTANTSRSFDRPASGATASSITQPRTRRPCSGTRTIAPTRTDSASATGTE